MRIGDGNAVGSTGGTGSMPYSFTLPLASVMWIDSVFFEVVVEAV